MKFKTIRSISVQEWDDLVEKTYGRSYSFQQQDGCKARGTFEFSVPVDCPEEYDYENDSLPEKVNGDDMGVSFKAWLARDPKLMLVNSDDKYDRTHAFSRELFWKRNFYPAVEMVIDDLHKKGLIEEGEYQIVIDW